MSLIGLKAAIQANRLKPIEVSRDLFHDLFPPPEKDVSKQFLSALKSDLTNQPYKEEKTVMQQVDEFCGKDIFYWEEISNGTIKHFFIKK